MKTILCALALFLSVNAFAGSQAGDDSSDGIDFQSMCREDLEANRVMDSVRGYYKDPLKTLEEYMAAHPDVVLAGMFESVYDTNINDLSGVFSTTEPLGDLQSEMLKSAAFKVIQSNGFAQYARLWIVSRNGGMMNEVIRIKK